MKTEGHKCNTCSKIFTRQNNLKRHINTIHEGHKDYICGSCDKSFSQAGNLAQHISTFHAVEKDPLEIF